ncbi:hypothetical protein RHS01_09361 [Rhizoctonia solani]|uniref:Uncharacterized protein n=1 Tax=Rhizoctonia solani TaxID=456999 RepID=A0A8H7I763_9AGAM|nr:hypothetical protein RHS01_09361 [Rhizoctonia solani]
MSQCPTASATPSTVLDSQPSGLLDATPYVSPVASTVWQSQELPLSQLTPRALKRRLDLDSQEEGVIADILHASPLVQVLVSSAQQQGRLRRWGNSIVPSMAPLESRESTVPAAPEGEETLGFFPKKEGAFVSEDTRETSCYEVIKDLVDHLLILRSGGNSLLEYAMGVTESHDLREDDKGKFAPISYEYLKKEADAWEAQYGTLTEEFLLGQCPAGLKAKTNRNEDFAYAMEAEDAEGFFGCLKEHQPCNMAMGYNNLKAFTGYFYRDKGALPQGVCEPKALKK